MRVTSKGRLIRNPVTAGVLDYRQLSLCEDVAFGLTVFLIALVWVGTAHNGSWTCWICLSFLIIFFPLLGGFLALATGSRCPPLSLDQSDHHLAGVKSGELFIIPGLTTAGRAYRVWLLAEDYSWIPSLGSATAWGWMG